MNKKDFIDYIEERINIEEMPENVKKYWDYLTIQKENKPLFTETGKQVIQFLQENKDTETWKSKDVAEELFMSTRTISGAMRKLVTDGYVDKVGQDPVLYSLTEKGLNITLD